MNPTNADKYDILVAKCGRSIGLKGNLRLIIYTDFMETFTRGSVLKCGDRFVEVECFDASRNLIKFIGIDDIDSAKRLNSLSLYTTREKSAESCKLGEGEFFWFEIIGLTLYDGDLPLGAVVDIERIGALNYLIVESAQKKRFMVPYIPRYIIKTDLEARAIHSKDTLGILETS